MTYARNTQGMLKDTPYVHVWSRMVRRCFLLGFDSVSGRDYSHRKRWLLERLQLLLAVFAIDCCAYAVMSNHYHLGLAVAMARTKEWSQREVVSRWSQLFKVPPLVQRWYDEQASEAEAEQAQAIIECWRVRLYNISWFMRCLNQYMAERVNEEEGMTGQVWDGRYRSQALLDEAALLSVMAYIDLNPVRADVAQTPEESEFTSIHQRILELRGDVANEARVNVPLLPFKNADSVISDPAPNTLPYRLEDYLALVDWTGRIVNPNKRGAIAGELPPILQRLGIDSAIWAQSMRPHGNVFGRAIGRLAKMRQHAVTLGQCWIRGLGQSLRLYTPQPLN